MWHWSGLQRPFFRRGTFWGNEPGNTPADCGAGDCTGGEIAAGPLFPDQIGSAARAVGDNAALVTALGKKNMGAVKILGLALSNGLVALAGGIVCQADRSFTSTMGAGQVVFGLASVIIGISLFRKASFVRATTAVLVGSILYKACIQAAMQLGFPALYAEICYGYAVFAGAGPIRTEGRDDHSCLSLYR